MDFEFMKKRIIDMLEDAGEEDVRIVFYYVRALLYG